MLQMTQLIQINAGCLNKSTDSQQCLLGIDKDDECQEEDKELVLLLQIDIPHVESDIQLARRCKQCIKLQATPTKNTYKTLKMEESSVNMNDDDDSNDDDNDK